MKPNVTLRSLSRSILAASVLAAVTGFAATAQARSQSYVQ
jgi:hypothetical protein